MDLPPSGWYPDPHGVPGLLRWWDGSAWTHHTHADGAVDAADGGQAAAAQQAPSASGQATTVQAATVQQAGQQAGQQAAPPIASTLATTVPQPVLLPTAVQRAVEAPVQPTTVQPAGRPGAAQPTTVQPLAMQPGAMWGGAAAPGHEAGNGTQVLFPGGDAWSGPGVPSGPGGPGGPAQGDWYGYQRVQRRRRIWVACGLVGGTAVAIGVIVLVLKTLGQNSPSTGPTQAPAPTAPVAAVTSASPSPTATGTASTLTDGQTGLSYPQLATPWQPTCPGGLNTDSFTWTAGESAVAGQVNQGQTTWYGAACSAPLPQQYGYSGVADLANVANTLANQFNGSYYGALDHNFQVELSQPLQVSGHAGWEVKFLISYTNAQGQGVAWPDEAGAVVVADNGTGAAPAVFYASVPHNLGENNVDTLVSSLQLTVTPQMAASASASAASASASDGGGDGGHGGGGNGP